MAGHYKVSYFNVRGLGDQIRLLMHDNGIKFEDHRFEFSEWPAIKQTMQFGQVPVLFDGDFQLVQSSAIMRHLARKHDLYGDSLEDKAYIDMFCDGIIDLRTKYLRMIYQDYENGKEPFIKDLPTYLSNYSKLIAEKNGGKAGFISGKKISYADYLLFDFLDVLLTLTGGGCLRDFPVLTQYHGLIRGRPGLAAYLGSDLRTKTNINGNGKQ
jgi:glutathione S-transferase